MILLFQHGPTMILLPHAGTIILLPHAPTMILLPHARTMILLPYGRKMIRHEPRPLLIVRSCKTDPTHLSCMLLPTATLLSVTIEYVCCGPFCRAEPFRRPATNGPTATKWSGRFDHFVTCDNMAWATNCFVTRRPDFNLYSRRAAVQVSLTSARSLASVAWYVTF